MSDKIVNTLSLILTKFKGRVYVWSLSLIALLLMVSLSGCRDGLVEGSWYAQFNVGNTELTITYVFESDHTGKMSVINISNGNVTTAGGKFNWEIQNNRVQVKGTYWESPEYDSYEPFSASFYIKEDQLVWTGPVHPNVPIALKGFTLIKK